MIMCVTYFQICWRFCWVVFGFVCCLDTFSASSCSSEKLSAVAAVWVLPSWALQFGAVTRHNKLGEYRQQGEACALVGARAQLLLQDEASGLQRQGNSYWMHPCFTWLSWNMVTHVVFLSDPNAQGKEANLLIFKVYEGCHLLKCPGWLQPQVAAAKLWDHKKVGV